MTHQLGIFALLAVGDLAFGLAFAAILNELLLDVYRFLRGQRLVSSFYLFEV